VTDAGLKDLAGLKLNQFRVPDPAQTDTGLKHYLTALKPPTELDLSRWRITDAGLKELAGLKDLETLNLQGTKVTDAGLKELSGLKSLRELNLSRTKVTKSGVEKLKAELPQCSIMN
jgi:Leucine-rich repeat (LRR) protein